MTAVAPNTPGSRATPATPRCLAIVPAYNEAASVAAVVAELRRDAPGVDILVVDDGSTDGTAACVPAGVTVLRLPINLGIGGAMQTGYLHAARHGYEVAVQVDGDGQHPAAGVQRLVARLRETGADLVIGSRFLRAESEPAVGGAHPTAARRAGIGVLRGLIRALTGLPITDPTSGFRAAGPRAIAAFAHWYPDDYPEPEVVLLLHRAGYRVAELPVAMRERAAGRSSIRRLAGVFYVLKVAAALLLDMVRQPWPAQRAPRPAQSAVAGDRAPCATADSAAAPGRDSRSAGRGTPAVSPSSSEHP